MGGGKKERTVMVKISEIEGFKESFPSFKLGFDITDMNHYINIPEELEHQRDGFNQGVRHCSAVQVTVDVEKLAKAMFERQPYLRYSTQEMLEWAKAISYSLPSILKLEKPE